MNNSRFHTPLLSGEEILPLIPQRFPIVMVDRFYGIDNNGSYTGLQIESDNLFCNNGILDECGITEHIAQSGAVRIGYLYRSRGETPPIGFIGSVDKMTFHFLPEIGEELYTILKVEQEVLDISLISAKVYIEDKLAAEGQMKIFLKKEA